MYSTSYSRTIYQKSKTVDSNGPYVAITEGNSFLKQSIEISLALIYSLLFNLILLLIKQGTSVYLFFY